MTQIEAIYDKGVFKRLREVRLLENQRVRLHVEPLEGRDVGAWLAEVRQLQQQIVAERGYFPDNTQDIAPTDSAMGHTVVDSLRRSPHNLESE